MPVAQLQGLTTISNAPISTNPQIDTGVSFSTSSTSGVPTQPSSILTSARTSDKNTFLNQYKLGEPSQANSNKLYENLQSFHDSLGGQNIDQNQNVEGKPGFTEIRTYINSVSTSLMPVLRAVKDTLEQRSVVRAGSAVEEQQAKTDEAKTRLDVMTNPEQNVGYYEGWFPLFRPMNETVLFSLFGVGLFCLLMSVAIFLNMGGVNIQVSLPNTPMFEIPDLSTMRPYLIAGVGIGALGGWLLNKYVFSG